MKHKLDIVLRSEKGFEDWSLEDIVGEYEKRVLGSMIKKGATLEEKNQFVGAQPSLWSTFHICA